MKSQLEVHIHTNNNCNIECKHCYNNSSRNNGNVMMIDTAINLINYICSVYKSEIHLEGGEIFLLPELLSKMDNINDEYLKCITITTNGTIRLTDEKIISMLSKINVLRISVEGHNDVQQKAIRGIGIDKVLNNALFYKQRDIPVCLRITLNRLNYSSFVNETLLSLLGKGFNEIQIYEFQKVGRGNIYGSCLSLDDSIEDFLKSLINYSDKLNGNIKIMFSKRRVNEIIKYKKQLEENGYCVEALTNQRGISIHADGDVFICPWDNDKSHCLINIMDNNIENVFHILDTKNLVHECEYCSMIRIVKSGDKHVT